MFKSLSIKIKLLFIIIGAVVFVSIAMMLNTIWSLNKQSDENIKKMSKNIYQAKEEELKNYVSLALNTVNSYYKRSSKEQIKDEVQHILKNQTNFLFSNIEATYKKYKDTLPPEKLKKLIKNSISASRYGKTGYF